MHLLESDATLSKPIAGNPGDRTGAGDWYVLIEGTDIAAIEPPSPRARPRSNHPSLQPASTA